MEMIKKLIKIGLFFCVFLSFFYCRDSTENCCKEEGMTIIDKKRYNENGDNVLDVFCKDSNQLLTRFRFVNKKKKLRSEYFTKNLVKYTKYDNMGNEISIDTIYTNEKTVFPVGWRWYKYAYKNNEIVDVYQEYFLLGKTSITNQIKILKNDSILADSSLFYEFTQFNKDVYELKLNIPSNISDSALFVSLCLSDKIKSDFSNIEGITSFDTIWAVKKGNNAYWRIRKRQDLELRGFIEIQWQDYENSENGKYLYLGKKIFLKQ